MLGRCIERGLSSEGRLCRFIVNVKDRPGGIAELAQLIASIGVRYRNTIIVIYLKVAHYCFFKYGKKKRKLNLTLKNVP